MSLTAANKIAEEIRKDLFSGDDLTVMKAVHRCREEGSALLMQPLLAVFSTTGNANIRSEILDMLSTLKVSGVEQDFLDALKNPAYRSARKDILTCIWSSGLQPVEGVALITEIAAEGTYEEAIECLTILENMEDEVPESELLEASSIARTFISFNSGDPKIGLMADLLAALEGRSESFE